MEGHAARARRFRFDSGHRHASTAHPVKGDVMGEPHIVVESRMQATTTNILDDIRCIVENGATRQITDESAMDCRALASPIEPVGPQLASTGRAVRGRSVRYQRIHEDCEMARRESNSWLPLTLAPGHEPTGNQTMETERLPSDMGIVAEPLGCRTRRELGHRLTNVIMFGNGQNGMKFFTWAIRLNAARRAMEEELARTGQTGESGIRFSFLAIEGATDFGVITRK